MHAGLKNPQLELNANYSALHKLKMKISKFFLILCSFYEGKEFWESNAFIFNAKSLFKLHYTTKYFSVADSANDLSIRNLTSSLLNKSAATKRIELSSNLDHLNLLSQ